ncbi:TetR/AcrR family transcriptional regulator [Serratia rhizosphaerae]|uniref:TetR/AcrR family transcriptional regulator n=1 Tax=unclassified Serratia (in: enterobacteria) TaxID=2647522 RepID=UPI000CF617E9|nr:TetR family transcriptional regulator [Serratia sp. MYb239]MBU3894039.1 TetR/AcrR family transcriptional regulator [Serratia rubidaea]MCA4823312.1 TetR/AcrR family transcriptional regulator [Serratia rubidaea]QNK34693.1 TetR/AcrR family transcriptional regulator [Serratia sp. JUb9]QPT12925.1 TetR/AcrR family transcriptional regulator [Serratia rubidaea]
MSLSAFPAPRDEPLTHTRARTRKLLLASAMELYDDGAFPSITELAAHAQVSRATAYRYFPTQSALITAVVAESLGPILQWEPNDDDALLRIQQLLAFAYPQMEQHEGALRAALQLSLQQWANATPGEKFVRGNRKRLLKLAVEPLQDKLPPEALQRVIHAFSLIYGSEVFLVLKDIWGLELSGIQDVTQWMAKAIIRQAEEDVRNSKK